MTTPYKHMPQAAKDLFNSFSRIDSDSYGNPRYYIPGFCLSAGQIANRSRYGLTKYRGRKYGPGYVVQTYSLEETVMRMIDDSEVAAKALAEFRKSETMARK